MGDSHQIFEECHLRSTSLVALVKLPGSSEVRQSVALLVLLPALGLAAGEFYCEVLQTFKAVD